MTTNTRQLETELLSCIHLLYCGRLMATPQLQHQFLIPFLVKIRIVWLS